MQSGRNLAVDDRMTTLIDENVTTPLLKHASGSQDVDVPVGESELDSDEWGGDEGRRQIERELLWKVDKRMSILVLIYILNYVSYVTVGWGRRAMNTYMHTSCTDRPKQRCVSYYCVYFLYNLSLTYDSAARLRGFEEDLHLEGTQFASILSILYVGYISMQIPSYVNIHETTNWLFTTLTEICF